MRTFLRLAALAVAAVGLVFWLFGGPNLGWTKTSVPHPQKDSVTGQEYVAWEKRFVPGVDFLAVSGAAGAALLGASLCIGKKH